MRKLQQRFTKNKSSCIDWVTPPYPLSLIQKSDQCLIITKTLHITQDGGVLSRNARIVTSKCRVTELNNTEYYKHNVLSNKTDVVHVIIHPHNDANYQEWDVMKQKGNPLYNNVIDASVGADSFHGRLKGLGRLVHSLSERGFNPQDHKTPKSQTPG